jgi:hypothetical protein
MLSIIHLLIVAVHLLATIAKLLRPGGVRAVVAEIHVAKAPSAAAHSGGGIDVDKDIVRRVLAHYRPEAGTDGPSWLSFIGHMKDSLWSVDLFRQIEAPQRSARSTPKPMIRRQSDHRRKVASSPPELRSRPIIAVRSGLFFVSMLRDFFKPRPSTIQEQRRGRQRPGNFARADRTA